MNRSVTRPTDDPRTKRYYHGTRADLKAGDLIEPADPMNAGGRYVHLSSHLDGAIWEAEIASGEGTGRVYLVEPTGRVEDASDLQDWKAPSHPSMSCFSRAALRVTGEVTEWLLYHGTRADLKAGDLIEQGHTPNFGDRARTTRCVYFTRTLDAATWGAELAVGEARGRIYIVEPTGPIEEDPNLTNKKFRGNPTKSFRSRDPLRVVRELTDWEGHSPAAIQAMRDGLERLKRLGLAIIEE
jgi:rifampin ADP-ribosylating transferase